MKTLNLNTPILDLDQNEVKDPGTGKVLILGHTLAQALIQSRTGDALKFLDWALELKGKGVLNLDSSDLETLKGFVSNTDSLAVLIKGQILKKMVEPVAKPAETPAPAPANPA